MYEQLAEILSGKFQVPADEIEPTAELEDLGLDSLDLVELALVIEKELAVRVTDDELVAASRFGDVVDLVTSRRTGV